jgi:predicted transcriptional regulator
MQNLFRQHEEKSQLGTRARSTRARESIWDYLKLNGPSSPAELAKECNINRICNLKNYLKSMKDDGLLFEENGKFGAHEDLSCMPYIRALGIARARTYNF